MKDKLLANIGKTVTIENAAQNDFETNKVCLNFAGKLEHDEYDDSFYVRVGDDYAAGSMGINFKLSHVLELDKRIYGELRIILK